MGLAARARIFGSDVLEDDQAGGDVLELLAGVLADAPTLAPALGAGAILGGDVVDDLLARQARRQRFAAPSRGFEDVTFGSGAGASVVAASRAKRRSWPGSTASPFLPNF